MKFAIEAHVKDWCPPEKVHFDEGLKLPIGAVPKGVVQYLIRRWVQEVCKAAEVEFALEFHDQPADEQTDALELGVQKGGVVVSDEIVMGNVTELHAENERLRAQIETAKKALWKIEQQADYGQMDACQRLASAALKEWESTDDRA